MKLFYTLLVTMFLVVTACNRTHDGVKASSQDTNAMREERDAYVKAAEAKLAEFDKKFDGLDARAKALNNPAKRGFNDAVDGLRDQRAVVNRKLDDLKKVSVESWMTLKGEVDGALDQLERSYEQVSATHETVPAAPAPATPRR